MIKHKPTDQKFRLRINSILNYKQKQKKMHNTHDSSTRNIQKSTIYLKTLIKILDNGR